MGHIGSALSIADILVALFSETVDPEIDVFILSKGHAALAQYCVLAELGLITLRCSTRIAATTRSSVSTRITRWQVSRSPPGRLAMDHHSVPALRLRSASRANRGRVFVLMSDAELNEGSVWEAVMFAGHHKLDTLTVILDNNGQQALAPTAEVINLSLVDGLVSMFGWECRRVDGHDVDALTTAFDVRAPGRPLFVIADTVAGKGVSFMERQVKWHYLPVDDAQFAQALGEIG